MWITMPRLPPAIDVNPGMGFGSFNTTRRTLRGYEAMNMIRIGQIQGIEKGDILGQVEFVYQIL